MTEEEKMTKVDRAAQKVKQAQAEYRKAVREEKKKERKAQDRHKYMMGDYSGVPAHQVRSSAQPDHTPAHLS